MAIFAIAAIDARPFFSAAAAFPPPSAPRGAAFRHAHEALPAGRRIPTRLAGGPGALARREIAFCVYRAAEAGLAALVVLAITAGADHADVGRPGKRTCGWWRRPRGSDGGDTDQDARPLSATGRGRRVVGCCLFQGRTGRGERIEHDRPAPDEVFDVPRDQNEAVDLSGGGE